MFHFDYVEIFKSLPPQLSVFLISLIPIAELRASIPVALGVYGMPVWEAIFWSVFGDIFVAFLLINFLDSFYKMLNGRFVWLDKFFCYIFDRTRKKFSKKYEVWGSLALMIFVTIPLPVTGSWTASVAAWLFGIPKPKALLFISLGVIIAAAVVTLISLGVISFY